MKEKSLNMNQVKPNYKYSSFLTLNWHHKDHSFSHIITFTLNNNPKKKCKKITAIT